MRIDIRVLESTHHALVLLEFKIGRGLKCKVVLTQS
jgi:hypothetical protein